MGMTEAGLFALLRLGDLRFRRLAEQHREVDRQGMQYDRIYYLTSEQEQKRADLQRQKAILKDEMSRIMRLYAERNGRSENPRSKAKRAGRMARPLSATT